LGGFTSVGATVFIIVIDVGLLMAERGGCESKVRAALGDAKRAEQTLAIVS